ncbi:putative virion structural protein [Pseudomonas phage OBP]|uniref:putative virion structural protein n=1 Tax=Pseudomonas phage OBP TaxID=1124849 RepID=UPI000240D5EB|nr:putative virion structural protein [Pseudomonas phage OBP]AEV89695.1 putative virion structural protein [Pseudomonas phage OBP]
MSSNIIPAVYAAGSFEALPPFTNVVDPKIFYTVEAVRTVPEMQALKVDLFKTVFAPAGVDETTYKDMVAKAISDDAVVVSLTSRGREPVYVLSTYIKSFPLVDGVIYERMCIITDLGACPPATRDRINAALEHFANYVKKSMGIANPKVSLGTMPTRGYVSKEQAEAWEKTRQTAIVEEPSDLVRAEKLTVENQQLYAYIAELEGQLKALNP